MENSIDSLLSDFENALKFNSSSYVVMHITRLMRGFYNSIQSDTHKLQTSLGLHEKDMMFVQGVIDWLPGIKDCFSVSGEEFPNDNPRRVVDLYKMEWGKPHWTDDMILESLVNCMSRVITGLVGNVELLKKYANKEPIEQTLQEILNTVTKAKHVWELSIDYIQKLPSRPWDDPSM